MDRHEPLSEYLARLEFWRESHSADQKIFIQLGNFRLGLVLLTVLLGWLAFFKDAFSGWLLLAPLAVFIALIVYHERVARRQQLAERGIAYYDRGVTRLDDRWAGTGNPGDRFANPEHIYSGDLDLFGKGSLFELLCVARTAEGEQTLAGWLLAPAPAAEVQSRQEAVADLRSRVQLREDIALLGEDVRSGVHAAALAAWGAAKPIRFLAGARWIALALSAWNLVAFILFMSQGVSARTLLIGVGVTLLFGVLLRRPTLEVIGSVDTPSSDLQVLALLLARLEKEQFEAPRLRELRAALDVAGLPASHRIARLRRWMEFLDSSDHLLVRVIGPALLWRQQAAMAIESWRQQTGPRVGNWIAAVAELEALSSLAALAYERPHWTVPELVDDGPMFEGDVVRHPLMNPSRAVPNDVAIGGNLRLLIISGSNMSGKSTLLRAVGLNTVLAWAGSVVAAQRLKVSLVTVAASMRVVDSLQDGKSRFYAEITRLRQMMDLTLAKRPVLFLLDELLSGTNSHDRRIGAEAVVRTLVERGAIGFVTTHDLALTQIASSINDRAVNVHFEDQLENGQIHFDYKMRSGVVERSNALELMRAVGLEV